MGMGGVYFIECGPFLKIGWSTHIAARLLELQRANPEAISLVGAIPLSSVQATRLERVLHKHFAPHRHRHEWFRDCDEIRAYIDEHGRLSAEDAEQCRADLGRIRPRNDEETLRDGGRASLIPRVWETDDYSHDRRWYTRGYADGPLIPDPNGGGTEDVPRGTNASLLRR